jgi:hypothetical protein
MTDPASRPEAIQLELHRLRAVTEIQNLMGTYTVNHLPKNMHDHIELFAMEFDDVSVEVGDRGVYVGPEALRTLFGVQFQMDLKGNLLIHYLATPMIEVAGDGKTAKGVWRSPGIEAVVSRDTGHPEALWSFGAYACDFIHVGGRWKIWHLHWFRTVKSSFAKGWVEDLSMAFGAAPPAPTLKPTTYHNPYTPQSIQASVPPCPKPYATWTEDDVGWDVREQILGRR